MDEHFTPWQRDIIKGVSYVGVLLGGVSAVVLHPIIPIATGLVGLLYQCYRIERDGLP